MGLDCIMSGSIVSVSKITNSVWDINSFLGLGSIDPADIITTSPYANKSNVCVSQRREVGCKSNTHE